MGGAPVLVRGGSVNNCEDYIMGNLSTALVVVLAINVMLFMGQAGAMALNPDSSPVFYSEDGSLLSNFDEGNYTTPSDPKTLLPSGEASVNPETGNIFTDIFSATKNWILETTGLSYLLDLLGAPANFLKAIGLPSAFAWAIGSLWYGITLFLIVAFILGRDT